MAHPQRPRAVDGMSEKTFLKEYILRERTCRLGIIFQRFLVQNGRFTVTLPVERPGLPNVVDIGFFAEEFVKDGLPLLRV
jgi:hypothetical protein